ncbi:Transcription factor spt8 [Tolypocladium ophioglossoides CBS 100239]|uniref:Transcription factor spt8 n=1 Tax=Tolypocladium ophioglossoides (strain CBS 100239) TaxID=1163406 RepID=A0A0L0NC76_TOLOC|nr:Transcription factor spt8 [Tolypocladium ophioglossoides CBS 100239]
MDEEDRFNASSAESERENEQDEAMEDAEDANNDNEPEEENNDEEEEEEGDNEGEGEDAGDDTQNANADASSRIKSSKSATPAPLSVPWRPTVRPEAISAKLYDIVPTMAAPQSTSINAMAITPDLRYWITGGSDGYIRKYDGPGTINGKLALTVAQKHPFVDSVTKAGILMSYWENEEPSPPSRGDQDHVLSPVYSLAVHSDALWLLSGLESGGINLQSVRHDEGKKICCLQQHTNAVSVLTLAPDEKSVLSGGWDKNIFDWDLNIGQTKRSFDGNAGQISSIELRPASGAPVPAEADEPIPSSTMVTNNGAPLLNGVSHVEVNGGDATGFDGGASAAARDAQASPAHESLFGGSDAGSLFGETAGEQPFGHDDDGFGTGMEMMGGHEGGMDHSADMAMAGMEVGKDADGEHAPSTQTQTQTHTQPRQDVMEVDPTSQAQGGGEPECRPKTEEAVSTTTLPLSEHAQEDHSQPQHRISEDKELLKRSQSQSPLLLMSNPAPSQQWDPSQTSATTFLSSAIDGTIRIWDRRAPNAVARIGTRAGVPPWCMSACWSPDGNRIFAGRRNGTVEEFDVRRAMRGWEPERVLKFPAGSGAVSAVKSMVNGRHLVCASHDIMRLYDLRDTRSFKHSTVPFLIIPGPPRAGVISGLYIDPTSRFMLSAAGTRGWDGTSTEALIGYEINVVN